MAQKIMTVLMTTRLPNKKYSGENAASPFEQNDDNNDSSRKNLGIDNIDDACDDDDASTL